MRERGGVKVAIFHVVFWIRVNRWVQVKKRLRGKLNQLAAVEYWA